MLYILLIIFGAILIYIVFFLTKNFSKLKFEYKLFIILIFVIISLGLIISNPKLQDHKSSVKQKAKEIIDTNLKNSQNNSKSENNPFSKIGDMIGGLMLDKLVDNFIESNVTIDNYFLFSLTKIQNPNTAQKETVGIGILGNVYIPQEVANQFTSYFNNTKNENNLENNNKNESLNTNNQNNLSNDAINYFDALPKNWTMLTQQNGQDIIFNPCDSINETIELGKNENQKYTLYHNFGQDGYSFIISDIRLQNNKYIFDLVPEENQMDENEKNEYSLEIVNNKGIWKITNVNGSEEIITTDAAFAKNYKIINEPPCLD